MTKSSRERHGCRLARLPSVANIGTKMASVHFGNGRRYSGAPTGRWQLLTTSSITAVVIFMKVHVPLMGVVEVEPFIGTNDPSYVTERVRYLARSSRRARSSRWKSRKRSEPIWSPNPRKSEKIRAYTSLTLPESIFFDAISSPPQRIKKPGRRVMMLDDEMAV